MVDGALEAPIGVLHGEFYASNILIRNDPRDDVCPVDWEMTGLGPLLLDVAALTSGNWSAEERLAITAAYYDAIDDLRWGSFDTFLHALGCCRVLAAVQWLGWARHWTPPAEHRHDWTRELGRLLAAL